MTLRKICYHYHEALSVVDFSCAFNTYGSSISKTGMLFRKGSVFVLFLLGHVYEWAYYLNWVGEDNQHLWSDGRSHRSLLYVILKGKDCK